jgi:TPR repeat protein
MPKHKAENARIKHRYDQYLKEARRLSLGAMYGYNGGLGVLPKDLVIAHMWFNLVAARGDKTAERSRDIAAKSMSPADISLAQRLARECLARKYKNCGR